ncbi:hypothetical protein PVAP13_7KG268000 [Panicum virgatum]|uniref:Uncharacterized protein n=1 Tax=Panicum virgatum TaxID=38727 RepID=A0A8T0QLH6_PANVG|nr:hypothetical protein PVAP13_7KG268000 [Panicum virgatum]
MPPPGKPYTRSAAAAAPEADEVDPDYLFFLDHVRLDGDAYALYIPSEDGVSPPVVIRYEQPLPGSNVGDPVTGSEYGGQGAPRPSEGDSLAARDSPHAAPYAASSPRSSGGKRKAPEPSPRVEPEARSGAVPMEEDPAAREPAWYDSLPAGVDEDYRLYLRHYHGVDEGTTVVKMGGVTIHVGDDPSVDKSDAEEDEDESILASGHSGEDTVGTEEEENMDGEKEAGLASDLQIVNVFDSEVKEEEVDEEGEDWEVEAPDSSVKTYEGEGKEVGPGSELQIVNVIEFEDGEMLSAPIKGITDRSPIEKERRTRRNVVYYPWKHEMGKSYFDNYPDLAEQFRLQDNNYPNRLALLRGFFFWLQNVGREDQFRPWTDDFKRYRVVEEG